jgi:phosphoserine phosphatase
MAQHEETILVHLTGQDAPGLTAALMARLAELGAGVLDVDQIAIRQRLHLSVLISAPTGRDLLKELLLFGWERGVQIEFEIVPTEAEPVPQEPAWFAVTLLGQELGATHLAAAAGAIARGGGNIERILCLARYPVTCYELSVSAADIDPVRAFLVDAARASRFDVAVQRDDLSRRAVRLVALDVDSTLIQDEVIDLLADEAGVGAEVAAITAAAMAGELDFEEALRARVALLAGSDTALLERARERLRLTPGARTFIRTLKRLGFRTAIMSGGFSAFTDALQADLGVDYAFANVLEVHDGRLTGRVTGPVVDRARKAQLLAEVAAVEGIELAQTVAVGDGANDLDMLAAAGLGIAFNAKPVVRDAADAAVSVPYLDAILFVLGIRRADVERADASEGVTGRADASEGVTGRADASEGVTGRADASEYR